jgi:hypothetical protein
MQNLLMIEPVVHFQHECMLQYKTSSSCILNIEKKKIVVQYEPR